MKHFTRTLNLITAAAFAAGITIPTLTHEAPLGDWVGSQGQIDSLPATEANVPQWKPAYAERFPGCTGQQSDADSLVVVNLRADVQRMDFGMAWDRNHNPDDGDDVWVVGWCAA